MGIQTPGGSPREAATWKAPPQSREPTPAAQSKPADVSQPPMSGSTAVSEPKTPSETIVVEPEEILPVSEANTSDSDQSAGAPSDAAKAKSTKDVGTQGTPTKDPKKKERQSEVPEQTETQVWNEITAAFATSDTSACVQIVTVHKDENYWDTSETAIDKFLASKSIPVTAETKAKEMTRRKAIQKVATQIQNIDTAIKTADAEIKKLIDSKITAKDESGIEAQRALLGGQLKTEIDSIRAQFYTYNRDTAIYTFGPKSPANDPVNMGTKEFSDTFLDAVTDLAADTTNKDRADKAGANLKILKKYRKPDGTGFEPKSKEALAREENLASETERFHRSVDVVEYGITNLRDQKDKDILIITRDENGVPTVRINPEADLKNINANDPAARLTLLVAQYVRLDGGNSATETSRSYLSALMDQELRSLDTQQFQSDTELTNGLRVIQNDADGQTYFNGKLQDLNDIIIKSAGLDPKEISLESNNLFRDVVLAMACEGKVTVDPATGKYKLPADAESEIIKWIGNKAFGGPSERQVIMGLAQEKTAAIILSQSLGFNLTELRSANAAQIQADRAIDAINKRRTAKGQKPYEGQNKTNFALGIKANTEASLAKITSDRKFPSWIAGLGLGLILIMPNFQSAAEESGEGKQQ